MGTWGSSLYDDDFASDLKDALSALCKVPADGDRLFGYLSAMYENRDPKDAEGARFWLVTADQFERRGIACKTVTTTALSILSSDPEFATLQDLVRRLKSPRPARAMKTAGKPPDLVLETGQVHAFPTMSSQAWHPYRLPSAPPFKQDGWGAMVVLATGRAFEWLPWCAIASLTVAPGHRPALDECLQSRVIPHPETDGVGRFIPKRAHARGMGLDLIGQLELDPLLVAPLLSPWPVAKAIQHDWTIAYAAVSPHDKHATIGRDLSSLVKR